MMTQDLFWIYGFNIFINSLLGFLTVTALVLLIIFAFRIKQTRLKAALLCLPVFKIIFDLFLYDFSNWALQSGINPIELPEGSRILSALLYYSSSPYSIVPLKFGIQMFEKIKRQTFTFADLMALYMGFSWVKVVVVFVGCMSLFRCVVWLQKLTSSAKWISYIVDTSQPCERFIYNHFLLYSIQENKVQIRHSTAINVPMAIGIFKKRIIFPEELVAKLTQGEYEAIIAHELDHLHWKDCLVRLMSNFFCTLFWWIPSKWWLGRLEKAQEHSCDYKIGRYNISPSDLASAILKSVHAAKN